MAARVERSRTKTQQMEGTELTPIQDMVVRVERYVQDLMRGEKDKVGALLKNSTTHIYICGLKGMEDGVMDALREIAEHAGLDWEVLWRDLKLEGRLHLETY